MATGQNYFQLINKVLVQMKFDPVTTFNALIDSQHLSIKLSLNTINNEIVNMESERWTFRERDDYEFVIVEGTQSYDMPDGVIHKIKIEDEYYPLTYCYDYLSFNSNEKGKPVSYSTYNGKILLNCPPDSSLAGKTATVFYHVDKPAVDGITLLPIQEMVNETDYSIIPFKYQDVLLFGAAWDVKGRPEQGRYQHFGTRFKALKQMMIYECRPSIEQDTIIDFRQGYQESIVDEFRRLI